MCILCICNDHKILDGMRLRSAQSSNYKRKYRMKALFFCKSLNFKKDS